MMAVSAGYSGKYVVLLTIKGKARGIRRSKESFRPGGYIIRLFIINFGWLYLNFRGGIIILIVY
jgi:hypothetical protein